jgi:hypothetical protein
MIEGTDTLAVQYEHLRKEAVSLAAGRRPAPGLALFLRKGMAAWMVASSSLGVTVPEPPAALSGDAWSWPCDIRSQVTTILTGMILGQKPEVNR